MLNRFDGDGLMVQCEVCLSWQHGHCTGYMTETQVVLLYVCVLLNFEIQLETYFRFLTTTFVLPVWTLPGDAPAQSSVCPCTGVLLSTVYPAWYSSQQQVERMLAPVTSWIG